jgi:hypothetical protein
MSMTTGGGRSLNDIVKNDGRFDWHSVQVFEKVTDLAMFDILSSGSVLRIYLVSSSETL